MSTHTRYIIWVDARDAQGWRKHEETGSLSLREAERITAKIRQDFPGHRVKFLPYGYASAPFDTLG